MEFELYKYKFILLQIFTKVLSCNMGPLDFYRKRATFDWKKLKVFIDSEEIIKYQVRTTTNTKIMVKLFIFRMHYTIIYKIILNLNQDQILHSMKNVDELPDKLLY